MGDRHRLLLLVFLLVAPLSSSGFGGALGFLGLNRPPLRARPPTGERLGRPLPLGRGSGAQFGCLRMAGRFTTAVTDPDPFKAVKGDMQLIKAKLKRMLDTGMKTSKGQISSAAQGMGGSSMGFKNLIERPEKSWRPVVILLLAQMLRGCEGDAPRAYDHSEPLALAEIIEIMHVSTLIHDTVLEDNDSLEKGNAVHKMYSSNIAGNKVSILAGDALLSRASVLSASLREATVVELVASALESLMVGQMQMYRPMHDQPRLNSYMQNVVLRAGNLMGKGCEAAAVLAGFSAGNKKTKAAQEYGLNMAIAYQLLKDLRVTEENYVKLLNKINTESKTKEGVRYSPDELNEPMQRAGPLLYASMIFPELDEMARKGFRNVSDVLHARSLIERCNGVEGIRRIAEYHAGLALDALEEFEDSEAKGGLRVLVHYMLEDGQERLMRRNYEDGVYKSRRAQKISADSDAHQAEQRAKKELYGRLDKLYGKAWAGVGKSVSFVKESFVSSVRGIQDRAAYDIAQLHKSAIRDAVLLFGKNVAVEEVHHYIAMQCAFKANAQDVEQMLHREIQWQIANGIETAADLEAMRSQVQGQEGMLVSQPLVIDTREEVN